MPQLDTATYTSQVFWLIVSFLLLLLVVRGLAAPRLARVVGDRAAKSGGDLTAAEAARAASAERDRALAERIAKAHDAARAELARATDASREKTGGALAELGQRLSAHAAEAEATLGRARASAEAELAATARDLTGDLVTRLTAAVPAPERIERALAEIRA